MGKHSRRQNTPNTRGDADMPKARVYPHDGIPVKGHDGSGIGYRYRSGRGVYAVTRAGAIVRIGDMPHGVMHS